jgi:hypothetical protein
MPKNVSPKDNRFELAGLIAALSLALSCHEPLRAGSARADGSATDDAIAAKDAGATGELVLVAGKLGGAGDLDGIGAAARFRNPFAVAKDGAGHLFVTDVEGHVVRQIDLQTGAVITLAGSPGAPGSSDGAGAVARFHGPAGIAADGAGNLFVADSGNNTIRQVAIATGAATTFAGAAGSAGDSDGIGAVARFSSPMGVASDGAGSLFVADSNNDTIRKIVIATGAVTTLAGSAGQSGYADGTGADARFSGPSGVASDGPGRVFVADTYNQLIRAIDVTTGAVTTLAGAYDGSWPGPPRTGNTDGIGAEARFSEPTGITADGAGNLFVADQFNSLIRKIVIATALVTTLVTVPYAPTGVVFDGAGNLFVVGQFFNPTIQKLVLATGEISVFAGSTENVGYVDGAGNDVRFGWLRGVACDGEGNLFVADGTVLRKLVLAAGTVTTFAGVVNDSDRTPVDGTGPSVRFCGLSGLASDGLGNLFGTDCNTVRKIDLRTGAVTTIAGAPNEAGTIDGTGSAARFEGPGAIACDGAGSLFVDDSGVIRKVDIATGTVTTIAGVARAGGPWDGVGTNAYFSFGEKGLACDDAGNVFVADSGSNTIRKIELATRRVTTIAGSAEAPGGADGIGTSARFDNPVGLVFDKQGSLLVGDVNNHTIRKIVIATQAVTTVAGTPGRMGAAPGPLPAGLSSPVSLAMGPAGELLIGDADEHAVLAVQF